MIRIVALAFALTLSAAAAPSFAEDRPRSVPDTPANFTLSGDQRWVVASVHQDGEAAIGVAREQFYEDSVRVARTKDGKYAVLVGPQAEQPAAEVKSRYEGRGFKDAYQSRGEEFVARAWQNTDNRIAFAQMQEGKPATLTHGALSVSLRLVPIRKKKDDESYVIVVEGVEDGKLAFRMRSDVVYSPETPAKASLVKLEGETPQVSFTYFTFGAHCCAITIIATKDDTGKWRVLPSRRLDGDAGPFFEDLDGDGASEMLSGDNRFLYQFSSYAESRMPARIEKVVGGKIVDVTRDPKYRRYHVQCLAALEAGADGETWKGSGFLAAWVAQKALIGERADALRRARKLFEKGDKPDFGMCMTDRDPPDRCPEKAKKLVPFVDALTQFLDRNGYR